MMYVVSSLSTLHNSRQHSISEYTNIARKKIPQKVTELQILRDFRENPNYLI